MLPKPVETPALLALKAKLDAASKEEMESWPIPSKEDFWLIGGIVVLYSHIDFDLRRIALLADHTGRLQKPWAGKTSKITMEDTQSAVLSAREWEPENLKAFDFIKEFRAARNILAHFAVRRFPNDAAFVFLTNSPKEYKRVFKKLPPPGYSMTAVLERVTLDKAIHRIEELHLWLGIVATTLEKEWGPLPEAA
jgi:hypothetical protein